MEPEKKTWDTLLFAELVFFGLTIISFFVQPIKSATPDAVRLIYFFDLLGLVFSVAKMRKGSKWSAGVFLALMFMFVLLVYFRGPVVV